MTHLDYLSNCVSYNEKDVAEILDNLVNLESLNVSYNILGSFRFGMFNFSNYKALKVIDISSNPIGDFDELLFFNIQKYFVSERDNNNKQIYFSNLHDSKFYYSNTEDTDKDIGEFPIQLVSKYMATNAIVDDMCSNIQGIRHHVTS